MFGQIPEYHDLAKLTYKKLTITGVPSKFHKINEAIVKIFQETL